MDERLKVLIKRSAAYTQLFRGYQTLRSLTSDEVMIRVFTAEITIASEGMNSTEQEISKIMKEKAMKSTQHNRPAWETEEE